MIQKFLLALQYWNGDRDEAIDLLELLSETVEPSNQYSDLCIFSRFDADPMPNGLVERLKNSFANVWEKQSKTIAYGWPDGCNAMWGDLAMECYVNSAPVFQNSPWAHYKACLSIESDCCPLAKDWMKRLSDEWDEKGASVLGFWHPGSHQHADIGHINGNMMFAMDISKRASLLGSPTGIAWDTYHAKAFKDAGWAKSSKIHSIWATETISGEDIQKIVDSGAAFLHGVKDGSAREFYRKAHK